jgi:transaldolase
MPEKTLLATQDEGTIDGDRVNGFHADAASVMAGLADQGIDMAAVTHDLEIDGVAKFVQSWHDLLATIAHAMNEA